MSLAIFKSCLLKETMLCINFTMELWLAPKYVKKIPPEGARIVFPDLANPLRGKQFPSVWPAFDEEH